MQGPESAPSGRDDTRWNGVRVHLSTVEGFAGDCSPPGGGGGVDCSSVVSHLFGWGEDAFVLIIQVHLGNCFSSYETSEKVLLFSAIQ